MGCQNSHNEHHFFLEREGRAVYCVEYLPDDAQNVERGVILCKPIWGERIRTHRIFTNLGRMLSHHGFSVITCDYFGDGNSGGETQDLTYYGMVDDVKGMYEHLCSRRHPKTVALIGFRIGASCALSTVDFLPGVNKAILIEPVMSPVGFLKDALRANLTTQMALQKKVVRTRDQLIEDLKAGMTVNIDGFIVSKKLWESFESVSPLQVGHEMAASLVVFSLTDPGRKAADQVLGPVRDHTRVKAESVQKEFIWTDWKRYVPSPPVLFQKVLQELNSD